jgi:hypothetical protein
MQLVKLAKPPWVALRRFDQRPLVSFLRKSVQQLLR